MENVNGMPLGEIWYQMTAEEICQILKQVVEMETKFMSLQFPACGSLYYQKDLPSEKRVPLPDSNGEFCIGPSAHFTWWQGERTQLDVDRGPSVGKRELTWAKQHAKPRLHYERLYREIHNFAKMHPDTHIQALTDYLRLTPYLGFKPGSQLNRPVLRHPDLQPNNILISEEREVVGLIDWQHSSILPLSMVAGIPKHIQNYGDPESDALVQPALDLPSDIDSMPVDEQGPIRETFRKRLVHFLYAEFTRMINGGHLYAIFNDAVILHQKLLESAGTPWEGDWISLQADIIRTLQQWSRLPGSSGSPPPITYSDEVIRKVLGLDAEQKEIDSAMDYMRNGIGIDIIGWVQNEDYEAAKEKVGQIKEKTIELAETEQDAITARDHFPFDDFDEDS
ncbi:Phosphotransferase enzyme [Aspergillus wentii]|nr:Phosphotransferase enzyme [Aspergillus wentii]